MRAKFDTRVFGMDCEQSNKDAGHCIREDTLGPKYKHTEAPLYHSQLTMDEPK